MVILAADLGYSDLSYASANTRLRAPAYDCPLSAPHASFSAAFGVMATIGACGTGSTRLHRGMDAMPAYAPAIPRPRTWESEDVLARPPRCLRGPYVE